MKISVKSLFIPLLIILSGCSALTQHSATAPAEPAPVMAELYEVHKDGRIYVFYDRALYNEFRQMGHTAFSINRIGAGPNGETLIFGLTDQDKKKASVPSIELIDGQLKPDMFYGEAVLDGRIYVFDSIEEMSAVRAHHEAAYRLTDIGAGPMGETVVYVLTSENKKQHPADLIAKFKSYQ